MDSTPATSLAAGQDLDDPVPHRSVPTFSSLMSWRRLLGLFLLLVVVLLWTASGFLASSIFADDTYSKPFFVTYINTAFFILALIPAVIKYVYTKQPLLWIPQHTPYRPVEHTASCQDALIKRSSEENNDDLQGSREAAYLDRNTLSSIDAMGGSKDNHALEYISVRDTALLSLRFSYLFFAANYFASASLQYTTVASATILNSTSSVFTLLFGTLAGVELFTFNKLFGVCASLAGVGLISWLDVTRSANDDRGDFPYKSDTEVAIGDAIALFAAVLYGIYAIYLAKKIGQGGKINMPLFFGFMGLINALLVWPGFVILHFTGVERFDLPPTRRVWLIVLLNATVSFIGDTCWMFALLLTSPLVVTVGLTLTIPLSLIGQMILNGQYSSPGYWFGACVVVLSFVFTNHESKEVSRKRVPSP